MMPVEGAADDREAWRGGLALAQALEAHIEAVFVRPDPEEAFEYFGLETTSQSAESHQMRDRLDARGRAEAERARRRFGAMCRKAGLPKAGSPNGAPVATAGWRTLTGEAAAVIPAAARGGDLSLFTASPARYSALFENLLEVTMLRSGRPALFIPGGAARARAPFTRPLIAWDATSGCVRAISALLDMTGAGAQATVLHIEEQAGDLPDMSEAARHLGWHGVAVRSGTRPRGFGSVGGALLDAAGAAGADLIVMGGYGRARYSEALFGGVTRYVLRNARLPVLMAH
ncbi:universal stress protein [Aestuariicoccus sp. MJ-SS9]|uniref:universal stress protein n=1 Tax=Aestuariicoccus sp. MJ-SS9 TaxID=3079855 RepID=UPI002906BF76|nr:universal stress protein [Aestuariicoccus sp. MJ-SS9]MDU8912311.1 universal stress protein [Aestuariicoccus sp. MJ-SS9]